MTTPITPERIAELLALGGYTPGPWHRVNKEIHDRECHFDENGERIGSTPMLIAETHAPLAGRNAEFIAAAPDLQAALAQVNADNERLRYVLDGVAGAIDTGRHEPLQIWREQIEICRAALNPEKTND